MVLLLMVIPSISLVSVNADEVDSYVVKYDSLISDDLNYLGYSDYVCDNSLEILTFSLGVDLNDKMLMYMYVYSDNDLSFYDITLKTTSCTDGLSSFSDTYSYVSKDENIYKFIYKKSKKEFHALGKVTLKKLGISTLIKLINFSKELAPSNSITESSTAVTLTSNKTVFSLPSTEHIFAVTT